VTFIRGEKVELRVLEDKDAEPFTKAVNAGLTTEHLFTGSIPMRTADYAKRWEEERKAGDILFGIWRNFQEVNISCHKCNNMFTSQIVEPKCPKCGNVCHWTADPAYFGWHFIGTCGLHSHRDIYKSWESRFLVFDPNAVGRGYGKEIVSLVTDYAFKRLNAHRVWLGVSENNLRAVKCYLDAGYVFEGRLRDEIFYNGRYHAALRMGVLEQEWQSIAQ